MADVTGPICTLAGTRREPPEGQACDYHPDRPAFTRVQGETDSFGCEMIDLCEECWQAEKAEMAAMREEMAKGRCDWCKNDATDLRDRRDYDEGMCGPVYSVCGACAKRDQDRINAELDSHYDAADFADDYDPDDYDPGEECGRWDNGKLSQSCQLAGTEFCDFECPHSR